MSVLDFFVLTGLCVKEHFGHVAYMTIVGSISKVSRMLQMSRGKFFRSRWCCSITGLPVMFNAHCSIHCKKRRVRLHHGRETCPKMFRTTTRNMEITTKGSVPRRGWSNNLSAILSAFGLCVFEQKTCLC